MARRHHRAVALVLALVVVLGACERGKILVGTRSTTSGPFLDARGHMAFPYSDARFRVDRDYLYLTLYAADEDIRSTDKFVVSIAPMSFEVGPVLSTAPSEVEIDRDIDGTLDRSSDLDEEWLVELSIPLVMIDTQPARLSVSRCDFPKEGGRRCGSFASTLELRP
jgi:hypothetical protein